MNRLGSARLRLGAAALLLAALALAGQEAQADPGAVPASITLGTLRDVSAALHACWRVPSGLGRLERLEITVRLSLKADGSLLGAPRISFSNLPPGSPAREVLTASLLDAVAACAPLPLSPSLGAALAGRVFTLRFVYRGPTGQGA